MTSTGRSTRRSSALSLSRSTIRVLTSTLHVKLQFPPPLACQSDRSRSGSRTDEPRTADSDAAEQPNYTSSSSRPRPKAKPKLTKPKLVVTSPAARRCLRNYPSASLSTRPCSVTRARCPWPLNRSTSLPRRARRHLNMILVCYCGLLTRNLFIFLHGPPVSQRYKCAFFTVTSTISAVCLRGLLEIIRDIFWVFKPVQTINRLEIRCTICK